MRVLYVAEAVPNRDPVLGDGSSMIPAEVIRHLPADVAVILLTFAGALEVPTELRERCEAVYVLATREHRTAMLRSLPSRYDVGTHERDSRAATAAVSALSSRVDATLMHGPHVLFLARQVVGPLVLQTVDPWSIRMAMNGRMARGWRAGYRFAKSRLVRLAERQLPRRARLVTVGEQDAAAWSEQLGRPVRSIPNGVEQVTRQRRDGGDPTVCFVGSLNYGPNVDSVRMLIEKIAPLVWQRLPRARFVIAGRQPVPEVLALAGDRVDVQANVPTVTDVFQAADVAVFPDEHGVGIRNSVREATAVGLPVVATPAAARDQAPHPLLTVEADTDALVARVVDRLTGAVADEDGGIGGVRTWDRAAAEYVEELEAAIRAARQPT